MTTGNPMGGAINPIGSANGNFKMSLNNLSAGTYTLTMLVGRGTGLRHLRLRQGRQSRGLGQGLSLIHICP